MVMRNRKKEALEFLAQLAGTAVTVYTLMWFMIVFS
jgi:hypothetical protein